jgi:hypothetical protein
MTEEQWLATCDHARVPASLRARGSERKLRLFNAAFVRLLWGVLPYEQSRRAVETVERFADGLASSEELEQASHAGFHAVPSRGPAEAAAAYAAYCSAYVALSNSMGNARTASGFPYKSPVHTQHAELFRDVFGDPQPVALDPRWRTPAVLALAQAAYEERELPSGQLDPARLAVLADALEEAGCTDDATLSHLRSPGPHVRGCWVIDLLIGRA